MFGNWNPNDVSSVSVGYIAMALTNLKEYFKENMYFHSIFTLGQGIQGVHMNKVAVSVLGNEQNPKGSKYSVEMKAHILPQNEFTKFLKSNVEIHQWLHPSPSQCRNAAVVTPPVWECTSGQPSPLPAWDAAVGSDLHLSRVEVH